MARTTISLPDDVYEAAEKVRLANGESRSRFFRRAVEQHLRRERERIDVEQYVRAYQRHPETAHELAFAEANLGYVMDENPWEEEPEK